MNYRVIVTPEAETAINQAFEYILKASPLNAARWLRNLYAKIDTLERFPERCARALEESYFDADLRQLVFQSHRIIFRVDKTAHTVWVLCARHSARLALGERAKDDEA